TEFFTRPELARQAEAHVFVHARHVLTIIWLRDRSTRMTSATRLSGVDAPAVMPMRVHPSIRPASISATDSIRYARVPARWATSTSRLELELFCAPTTRITCTREAMSLTAFWRFCVA